MKLTNGSLSQRMVAPAAAPGAGASIGGAASASQQTGATQVAAAQGTGSLLGLHNTPLHVGMIVLLAAGGLAAFRWAGFRFSFDAGFGK